MFFNINNFYIYYLSSFRKCLFCEGQNYICEHEQTSISFIRSFLQMYDNGYQTPNTMSNCSYNTCIYVSYSHFNVKEELFNTIMIIINIEWKHVLIRCQSICHRRRLEWEKKEKDTTKNNNSLLMISPVIVKQLLFWLHNNVNNTTTTTGYYFLLI